MLGQHFSILILKLPQVSSLPLGLVTGLYRPRSICTLLYLHSVTQNQKHMDAREDIGTGTNNTDSNSPSWNV